MASPVAEAEEAVVAEAEPVKVAFLILAFLLLIKVMPIDNLFASTFKDGRKRRKRV